MVSRELQKHANKTFVLPRPWVPNCLPLLSIWSSRHALCPKGAQCSAIIAKNEVRHLPCPSSTHAGGPGRNEGASVPNNGDAGEGSDKSHCGCAWGRKDLRAKRAKTGRRSRGE